MEQVEVEEMRVRKKVVLFVLSSSSQAVYRGRKHVLLILHCSINWLAFFHVKHGRSTQEKWNTLAVRKHKEKSNLFFNSNCFPVSKKKRKKGTCNFCSSQYFSARMELLSVKGRFFLLCKLLYQCVKYLVGGYKKELHRLQMCITHFRWWEFLKYFMRSQSKCGV